MEILYVLLGLIGFWLVMGILCFIAFVGLVYVLRAFFEAVCAAIDYIDKE